MPRVLKLLVRLRNMKLFAPLALGAPRLTSNQSLGTSNPLKGE